MDTAITNEVKNIWIIDDDEIFLFTAKKFIEQKNAADICFSFSNGYEAITAIRNCIADGEDLPQIVLLDINMPVMNGWEFLDEFHKLGEDVKNKIHLYILSSSIYVNDIERSREYKEVKDYIVKPLNKDVIDRLFEQYYAAIH